MRKLTQLLVLMAFAGIGVTVHAQTSAPPLTPDQLQLLTHVKTWDVDFSYQYTLREVGSGGNFQGTNISGWALNHTSDIHWSVHYTVSGRYSRVLQYFGRVVYHLPGMLTVTTWQNSRQEDLDFATGCPLGDTLGPGHETYLNSDSASGTRQMDSTTYEKRFSYVAFCIDTTVNPPIVRVESETPAILGSYNNSQIGCGDSMHAQGTGSSTGVFQTAIFPYKDSSLGSLGLGDTQIREEGGRFVIHGNFVKTVDTMYCGHSRPIPIPCEPSAYYPHHNSQTWTWVIREHPDSSYIVTRPRAEELWVTTTKDTIAWHSADTGTVNIFYSTDSGRTYQSIINNFSGADSQHYIWKVPKNILSRKATIKVESSADTTRFGESELFKIKGYELTRITPNGDYEAFKPDLHGWSFANVEANLWTATEYVFYATEIDSATGRDYPRWFTQRPTYADINDFPSWPLFVQTFGKKACYFDSIGNAWTGIYRTSAVEFWRGMNLQWHGSCQGLAISSAGAFGDKASLLQSFPQIGDFTNLYDLPTTLIRRKAINQLYLTQFGEAQKAYEALEVNAIVDQGWIDALKGIFKDDERADGIDMCMYNRDRSGGHVVTPYRVEQDSSVSDTVKIFIYDNNYPGDAQRFIRLTKFAGRYFWNYNSYGGISYLYYEPVSLYLLGAVIPTAAGRLYPSAPLATVAQSLRMYTPPGASILLTDAMGDSIGYADSSAFSNFQGAIPIIPRTGFFQPPIGYQVPNGSYAIHMQGFIDSIAYCSVFGDSIIYTYSRSGVNSSQTDQLSFADGFTIQNSDPSTKQIYAGGIIVHSDNEQVFGVANLPVGQNDSIRITTPDRRNVDLVNYGGQKTYTLQLRSASSNGDIAFEHKNIPLQGNALHVIEPGWDSLQTQQVKILIDQGNDGTIDDSLLVDNQVTGVGNESVAGKPTEYKLYQNYPNPFNPRTNFEFRISNFGLVSLKVYDVLGREVATLVNEMKKPGEYTVQWSAENMPSGVYFYRIQADGFVQTKKLILIR